jgi:putative RNA 2'-phosphotransferase
MLKHQPKTLAKILDYIARRSPGEHGLFWDPDGAMPWKELYWVLQEDPSLRFVRETSIRELTLLGIELPFALDGNLIRLSPGVAVPRYPLASNVPERLYFGLRPKNLLPAQRTGLKSAGRRYIGLSSERELATRIAGRREKSPVLIEIRAREASGDGVCFLVAGQDLYLAESVPVEFILFPKIRQDLAERLAGHGGSSKPAAAKPSSPVAPGSFIVQPHHFEAQYGGKAAGKNVKNAAPKGWKKERRKDRHKRDM